jgi:hypothetical protein
VNPNFPLLADSARKVATLYPASTGRNFDGTLRVIESLQLTSNYRIATPVNWQHGDDVIILPAGARRRQGISQGLPQAEALSAGYPAAQPMI